MKLYITFPKPTFCGSSLSTPIISETRTVGSHAVDSKDLERFVDGFGSEVTA